MRLAAAGAADDRRRLARLDPERDVAQDRVLGARVAELDVAEVERALAGRRRRGDGRVVDRRIGPEDLLDPAGRDDRARDQDEHEDGHHHREQDLHDVLQEGDQVADRHLAAVDTRMAPNHRMATDDRLKIAIRVGIISANSRLTLSEVAVRSWFATSKRSSSCVVRTNARMTRTPLSASRVTWLIAVDLDLDRLEERQRRGTSASRR